MSTVLEPLLFDPEKRWMWHLDHERWYRVIGQITEDLFHEATTEATKVVIDSMKNERNHARHTNEPPRVRVVRTRNNWLAQKMVADFLGLDWKYKTEVWMEIADVGDDIDVACTDHLAKKAIFREEERENIRKRRSVFVWILRDTDLSWWAVGMGWWAGDEFMETGTRCGEPDDYHWYVDPRHLRGVEEL
jgi:hypothetical protein